MKSLTSLFKVGMGVAALTFSNYTHASVMLTDSLQLSKKDTVNLKFTVEEAPEWSALFKRSSGWFGGDGIFAIPLNGKDNAQAGKTTETMFVFSDSVIGEIENGQLKKYDMVKNTVAFLKGSEAVDGNIKFDWAKDKTDKPRSIFPANTPAAKEGDYYWLGDGFVNTELNNTMYIFGYRMRNMDSKEDWSFKEMSTDIIAIPAGSRPPFANQRKIVTPLRFENGGFGAGIFVNTRQSGAPNPDGYVYVYGVRGDARNLMVARVLPKDFENFTAWRFWDGTGWNADMQKVAYIASGVSNELSVSALPDGRYALVFQYNSMSPKVGLRLGSSPYATFGPMMEIWDCKEVSKKNIVTYNAKAHPSLSSPGELLISYNVNAFDFHNEIKVEPNLYRPRFLRVKFQK